MHLQVRALLLSKKGEMVVSDVRLDVLGSRASSTTGVLLLGRGVLLSSILGLGLMGDARHGHRDTLTIEVTRSSEILGDGGSVTTTSIPGEDGGTSGLVEGVDGMTIAVDALKLDAAQVSAVSNTEML